MAIARRRGPVARELLQRLALRQDLALVLLILLAIFMIVMPLPTFLVDILIATNIGLSVLVLMVAVYLTRPVEISTLPAIILLSTLFRLALNITTTRLILADADAGQIIATFGSFVIGGNLIVGLVVFLIITIAQFIVITKGAERVAEVAARFSLDALPGKQMSIDSDMRSGEIDMAEARRRRQALQRESEFYGAMDGASKFVKGDAIAGLVIICINLLGGIGVGMLQQDMAFGEALSVYSLLTIGDGLVAQIPALMISVGAGAVVTRVADEGSRNLGSDIAGQLAADPRSLLAAALVVGLFAAVPGFPSPVFLGLAALLGGYGLIVMRRERRAREESAAREDAAREHSVDLPLVPAAAVTLELGQRLRPAVRRERLDEAMRRSRARLYDRLGVPFPAIHLLTATSVADDRFRLAIDGIPMLEGTLPADRLCVVDGAGDLPLLGIDVETAPLPGVATVAAWVGTDRAGDLERAGIAYLDTVDCLVAIAEAEFPRHAAQFLGLQETQALLAASESRYPDLVKEVQKVLPLPRIADVLRRLVEEGVSVRNLRLVLEALVEWGAKEKDVVLVAEYTRQALRRQICHRHASSDRVLRVYLFEPEAEEAVRKAIRHTAVGSYLALEPDVAERLVARLRATVGDPAAHDGTPVVLTAMDVRRHLRTFLARNGFAGLPVLSHQELAAEFAVQPLATVGL